MTSLRTFQNEIDSIQNREVAKQRAHQTTNMSVDKKPHMDKGKAKEEDQPKADSSRTEMAEIEERFLV